MTRARAGRTAVIPAGSIRRTIIRLRGHNVLLDEDLAGLYRVTTRELVQAVTRNRDRFPPDFMFQLTREEVRILRSQSVISRSRHGGRRTTPYAFTEQGVAMLSSVLRSARAVRVNIEIMRAFVHLRQAIQSDIALASKLAALERKFDGKFEVVFEAIRQLMTPGSPATPADRFSHGPHPTTFEHLTPRRIYC
jgi:ORF6N domain